MSAALESLTMMFRRDVAEGRPCACGGEHPACTHVVYALWKREWAIEEDPRPPQAWLAVDAELGRLVGTPAYVAMAPEWAEQTWLLHVFGPRGELRLHVRMDAVARGDFWSAVATMLHERALPPHIR